MRTLDGAVATAPGRGAPIADAWRGLREVDRAVGALLHGRAFIGRLRGPVAANLLAFAALTAFGWSVLGGWFAAWFAEPWWTLEGLRTMRRHSGEGLWLLTSWLLLGPPLLDAMAGVFQEPLRATAEAAMLGPPPAGTPADSVLRVRERARVLALAAAAWPLALFVVLLPWVGLPIVLAAGSAVAAIVWFEPPMAARGLGLPDRLRLLWRNRWRALGTGLGLQCAALVPFVNLLALAPVAALAATSSYLRFDKGAA
jgi:hypothetical protein